MLRIGEFSTLSTVSINMLRNYDEIGLLVPAYVDEHTGYRYYKEEQLPVANRIQALKSMGLELKVIRKLVSNSGDNYSLKEFLNIKANEKINEIKILKAQLKQIENTLGEIETEHEFAGCIAIKDIPGRIVAGYRSKIEKFQQEGVLWTGLYEECQKQKVQFINPEYNIAILHGFDEESGTIDVEVQKSVLKLYKDTEQLRFKAVKPIKVASLIFQGGYSKLKAVNSYVAKWVLENNYEFNGNLFNIYHISPGTSTVESNFVTEVCFPIKERN